MLHERPNECSGSLDDQYVQAPVAQMVASEYASVGAVMHCLFLRYFYILRHEGLKDS